MGEILRHKKTGGLYEVLFRGAVIHSDVPLSDDAPITVCRRLPDGQIVARFGPTPRGSFDVLHHSRLQTDVLLHDGAEVVVYRALNGWLVWVRPTAEMGDGRFEPADAPPAPSSTPGEVERLAERLTDAAIRLGRDQIHGDPDDEAASLALFAAARTALLSHISAAGRAPQTGDLAALSAAASPGMLALSPRQYDDWGMIRTTEPDSDGFGRVIFHAVILDDDAEKSAARSERRQPKIVKANADFLIRLWNDYRSGRLVERSADATNPQDQE